MHWAIAAAIGAALGAVLLALFARASAKTLALNGFFALLAMLSVYAGARLVTGTFTAIMIEFAVATGAVLIAWFAMQRWLPSIGIAIFLHGTYDAVFGPSTGVAEWYPPLCAGFDIVVGLGLVLILLKKQDGAVTA